MKIHDREIKFWEIPWKIAKHGYHFISEHYEDIKANYYMKKISNKENDPNQTIRVAFIVQMPEIWDKEEPVYHAMEENPKFDVKMIVIPPYDFKRKEMKINYNNNFFLQTYPSTIKAFNNGNWITINNEYDYIFYQRPYDYYLPKPFQSRALGKKAKCCYIPYAYWPLQNMLCGYNRSFFRNVYFAFMESKENANELLKFGNYERRILFRGYPLLENIESIDSFDAGKVLWTPRWSYSETVGGSHFFEYKDKILELSKAYNDIQLCIRPHPLAFDNYIADGLMTVEETDQYFCQVEQANASFDTNPNIEETFLSTGVLISDVSSIIFPFFLSGKPIIYCASEIPLSPAFEDLLEGMYVAHNWDDVARFYDDLYRGEDVLKDKRIKIAQRLREDNKDATQRIIETIEIDFENNNSF